MQPRNAGVASMRAETDWVQHMGISGSQGCLEGFAMQGLYCEECGKANGVFKAIAASLVSLVIGAIYVTWLSRPLLEDVEERTKQSLSQKWADITTKVQTRAKSLKLPSVADFWRNVRSQFFLVVRV
jgi:hypothetical protein